MIIVTDYMNRHINILLFKILWINRIKKQILPKNKMKGIRMNKIVLIFGVIFIVIAGLLIGTSLSPLENEDVVVMGENAETVEKEPPSNTEDDAMFVAVDALRSPNNELQQYISSQVEIDETHIHMTADKMGEVYLSGKAESVSAFRYGRFSFRINTMKGVGLFPAIWMLPSDTNSDYLEVDIYELIGNKPNIFYGVLHYMEESEKSRDFFRHTFPVDKIPETYRITFEWTQEEMVWYLGDEIIYTIQDNVPDEPLYFIFNLAVGGNWPGSPDADTEFPAMFEVEILEFMPQEIYSR